MKGRKNCSLVVVAIMEVENERDMTGNFTFHLKTKVGWRGENV